MAKFQCILINTSPAKYSGGYSGRRLLRIEMEWQVGRNQIRTRNQTMLGYRRPLQAYGGLDQINVLYNPPPKKIRLRVENIVQGI